MTKLKTCRKCGIEKDRNEFRSSCQKASPGAVRYICKKCQNRADTLRKRKNGRRNSSLLSIVRCENRRIQKHTDTKTHLFSLLGDECSCCRELQIEFLTLEHIKRDGAQHRRVIKKTRNMYSVVLAEIIADPTLIGTRYTLYCMNCNWAERHGKTCPHKNRDIQKISLGMAC
jgi:hypothetical protein